MLIEKLDRVGCKMQVVVHISPESGLAAMSFSRWAKNGKRQYTHEVILGDKDRRMVIGALGGTPNDLPGPEGAGPEDGAAGPEPEDGGAT